MKQHNSLLGMQKFGRFRTCASVALVSMLALSAIGCNAESCPPGSGKQGNRCFKLETSTSEATQDSTQAQADASQLNPTLADTQGTNTAGNPASRTGSELAGASASGTAGRAMQVGSDAASAGAASDAAGSRDAGPPFPVLPSTPSSLDAGAVGPQPLTAEASAARTWPSTPMLGRAEPGRRSRSNHCDSGAGP
jgi:hypothetical protein